jgi:hypothetical protein
MNKNTFWFAVIVIIGIASIKSGITGVVNRKSIKNLVDLSLSIGQIVCGVMGLIGVIIFLLRGT